MLLEKNTNVIELYNLILKKVEHNQRTWYNSGIGTYARPSWTSLRFLWQVIEHKIDLAIAWCVNWSISISYPHFTAHSFRNFEKTILAAYRWLSDNYEEGDCIFLFGALEQNVIYALSMLKKKMSRVFSWRISGPRALGND